MIARLLPAVALSSSILFSSLTLAEEEAPPKSLDPRLKVELYAEHPQIVTPTGIDVDHRGRVWVIESNTHHRQRREDYAGHDSDRVLVMSGRDAKGRAEQVTMFVDGLVHAMSIAVRPDGAVYVATRKEVLLYRDTDGDDKPDSRERVLHLDTPGDYPHNGLAGFAFDALGWMYVGMGENLGADYKLIGSDGSSHSGGGEGGNVFRCRSDGSELMLFATGFWNPHASCFDTFGRMFTVDNDPDSRPPCRLLHTIRGGDYGYRYRNGRRGVHPFTAWNGELPGTLPMVAGTGEAPSGIVAYESDGFPEEYIGSLLVGSWGDHRIDRFQLKPRGASFTSKAEPLIVGGENFRPVGLAVAPDGSLFFSDWVLKDYPVHGQGRIWRVSAVEEPQREVIDVETIPGRPVNELRELLKSKRIEVRRAAAIELAKVKDESLSLTELAADAEIPRRGRVELIWAMRQIFSGAEFWQAYLNWSSKRPSQETNGVITTCHFIVMGELNTTMEDFTKSTRVITAERLKDLMKNILKSWETSERYNNNRSIILAVLNWLNLPTYTDLPPNVSYQGIAIGFETKDPFIYGTLLSAVTKSFSPRLLHKLATIDTTPDSEQRLGFFLALRHKAPSLKSAAAAGLADPSPSIRRAAVQWIAEEDMQDLTQQLQQLLTDGDVSTDLFEATLAALAILDGIERDGDFGTKIKNEIDGSQYVFQLVADAKQSPLLRARALRMLDPRDQKLTEPLFRDLLAVEDPALTLETVRTLQGSALPAASQLLREIAADESQGVELRADAVAGLAAQPIDAEARSLLVAMLKSPAEPLRDEALRSLRLVPAREVDEEIQSALSGLSRTLAEKPQEEFSQDDGDLAESLARTLKAVGLVTPEALTQRSSKPPQTDGDWVLELEKRSGDPEVGRRIFFHAGGAGCYRCHSVEGRGGRIGPELSKVAGTFDRRKLIKSILEPSAEIAPQFAVWTFSMENGKTHTGVILSREQEGRIQIGDSQGKTITLEAAQIEERIAQKTSIMPEKLVDQLTVREFRDLLAFLQTLK